MNKIHESLENKENEKMFIRSKLMYVRSEKVETENDRIATEIYSNIIKTYSKSSKEYNDILEEVFQMSPLLENTILNIY